MQPNLVASLRQKSGLYSTFVSVANDIYIIRCLEARHGDAIAGDIAPGKATCFSVYRGRETGELTWIYDADTYRNAMEFIEGIRSVEEAGK